FEVVTQPQIQCQLLRDGPSIGDKGAKTRDTELRPDCPKCLPKLTGAPGGEIRQAGENVGSTETVRHRGLLADMVDCGARFPQMMSHAARIRIRKPVVPLAPLPISIVRTAELQ